MRLRFSIAVAMAVSVTLYINVRPDTIKLLEEFQAKRISDGKAKRYKNV